MKKQLKPKGVHYTVDFFGCDPHQLDSLDFWQKSLPQAAAAADMEILHSYFHQFDPQGITGFLLLSSSHISFHTWPEYNYVACDIFSCSHDEETFRAVEYLKKAVRHKRTELHKIRRGYVVMEYLESPIYANGKIERIKVTEKFAEVDSGFQKIVIINTEKYGRCMVIDGLVQTSEFDHETYDKAILDKITPETKNLLILGGGDGYVAETALKINPNIKITVVDLDQEVVHFSKKYLSQKIFSHPNVHLIIGDALHFVKTYDTEKNGLFDCVASDLTDNPIGSKKAAKGVADFYKKVFSFSNRVLKLGGWFSAQAGASKVTPKYLNSAKIMEGVMREEFGNFKRKDVLIPSYSEKNAFIYAQKKA